MRDPSHVRSLSRAEMLALYEAHGLSVEACEVVRMPVHLDAWMQHTDTPPAAQSLICRQMEEELSGGAKTGFSPYRREGEILFDQKWTLCIGRKQPADA